MSARLRLPALPLIAVLLAGLACSPSPATDTPGIDIGTITVVTYTPPSPPQSSGGGGECANDYFPIDEGASWEYASTAGGAAPQSRSVTVVSEGDDGFSVEIALPSGATFVIEWSCSEGDLSQLTPTAVLSVAGGSATVSANNHSGVTLPADLEAKPSWRESGEWAASAGGTAFQGTFTADNAAVGLEDITVPFGSFEAMRVESSQEGTLNGEPLSPCQITQWWATDVGLIKQETTCTLGSQEMTEVVELVSYATP